MQAPTGAVLTIVLSLSAPAAAAGLPELIELVPNIDDDDRDGQADWRQRRGVAGDDDVVWLSLEGPLRLRLEADRGRLQLRLPDHLLVIASAGAARSSLVGEGPIRLGIESAAPGSSGRLLVGDDPIAIRTVPMILPPALTPVELALMAAPEAEEPQGTELVASLRRELGGRLALLPGEPNQWFQDQVEIATFVTAEARVDLAFTAADADVLRGFLAEEDDLALDRRDHWDEFGNLEVSPPVTVRGRRHPWGRVLFGGDVADSARDDFLRRLSRDGVQSVVPVEVGWLCVGHVDEVVAFLPDPRASQGFVAVIPDPRLGLQVLDRADPTWAIPRYLDMRRPGRGWRDAGELQADRFIRWYNEDLADRALLRVRVTLIEELGLRWDEVIGLPALFEPDRDGPDCGARALVPNPVNMLVVDRSSGPGWLALISDPWFREPDTALDEDPFAEAIRTRLDGRVEVRFLEAWGAYHEWGGELHCAVGLRRRLEPGWHGPCCDDRRSSPAPGGPAP